MNLITDQWLPVIRKDGSKEKIAPWQITDGINDDRLIIEIDAPRADFKGALYQFLIGLLQTAFAPEDEDEWLDYWENAPDEKTLRNAFSKVQEAFDIDSEGPAFMQDLTLEKSEKTNALKPISYLLIDFPKENTLNDNKDHFIKRNKVGAVDAYWAAIALFTLQINGPPDGGGHREGLRGSGHLTTLLCPSGQNQTHLWDVLWLNVLPRIAIQYSNDFINQKKFNLIFPWLTTTRTSGTSEPDTSPMDGHPLQVYWPMPRRIRLDFENAKEGRCDFSGQESPCLITKYYTHKHGIKYTNLWRHPLTPYKRGVIESKKTQKPIATIPSWILSYQGVEQLFMPYFLIFQKRFFIKQNIRAKRGEYITS